VDVAAVDVLVVMTCTYVGRADTIGPRQRVARALVAGWTWKPPHGISTAIPAAYAFRYLAPYNDEKFRLVARQLGLAERLRGRAASGGQATEVS